MMGVDHNRNQEWVGASAGFCPRESDSYADQRNPSQPLIFCLSTYVKGQPFMRECARLGCRVELLTLDKHRNADWPRDILAEMHTMPEEMASCRWSTPSPISRARARSTASSRSTSSIWRSPPHCASICASRSGRISNTLLPRQAFHACSRARSRLACAGVHRHLPPRRLASLDAANACALDAEAAHRCLRHRHSQTPHSQKSCGLCSTGLATGSRITCWSVHCRRHLPRGWCRVERPHAHRPRASIRQAALPTHAPGRRFHHSHRQPHFRTCARNS